MIRPLIQAVGMSRSINVTWIVAPVTVMPHIEYLVARSRNGPVESPGEGDVVYRGLGQVFIDYDVEDRFVYYYTLFVVTSYDEYGDPQYFDPVSASASARLVLPARHRRPEHVPARGEFGSTVRPATGAQTLSIWGDVDDSGRRRTSDVIRVAVGTSLRSPITGVVRLVEPVEGLGAALLKAIEIENVNEIVTRLEGILLLGDVGRGGRLVAGQVIGRSNGTPIVFEFYKRSSDTRPRKTIRPMYFYLTIEGREGRR
jgi:hypothetical protein